MIKFARAIILKILKLEARFVLWRHQPFVVAITGSVGKTSAKEAIATLLGEHYFVRKSPKNFNSDIGVPLAILGLENAWRSGRLWLSNIARGFLRAISRSSYPEILVLEMGVDRPGDLKHMLGFVRPDIAVVTAIGKVPVHVEFFSGPEALAAEKGKLVSALSESGVAVLNRDDDAVFNMRKLTGARVLTYGFAKDADVRTSQYRMLSTGGVPHGISFKIDFSGKTMPIRVEGVVGEHIIFAFLAAAAVGIARGLNLIEISEGLAKYKSLPGRLSLIAGKNDSLIVDDSYNASPAAVTAALKVLEDIPAARRIAVLGDMLELGKFTPEAHRKVGVEAARVADVLVAVGVRAKFMENARSKEFFWFSGSSEAADFLLHFIRPRDVLLVKGSQGVRMEKIVETLMSEPEHARELLVRQEAYWKK